MFKILGQDGKEYGPVSAEQVHLWLQEGRAGATTRAQREGSSEWVTLGALPEFAALLAAPVPTVTAQGMPPVVRWMGQAMFVVAGLSFVLTLWSLAGIAAAMTHSSFRPGWTFIFSWVVALLSLPLRVVIGIGLLRGRKWARQLGIYFSVAMVVMGAWGLIQTSGWMLRPEVWPGMLRSPMFVLSSLFSVALFLFNIAVVIVLTRPVVRVAFQTKENGG